MPFTIRRPASSTCRQIAAEPMTNAEPAPSRRSNRKRCRAPPTVTTSSSEAWKPSLHSLRTKSSPELRASLVTKATPLPAARSSATADTARGVALSPTQTQPSRSRRTWS